MNGFPGVVDLYNQIAVQWPHAIMEAPGEKS